MSDWDNKGSISMSFDIKADEKAVDFFCEKVTLLADACGVTKHKED